ncbi:unnamed protein product [Closterium sp. NIES-65]|nr:unnamed protein product [Closterium sp. NIES-65]
MSHPADNPSLPKGLRSRPAADVLVNHSTNAPAPPAGDQHQTDNGLNQASVANQASTSNISTSANGVFAASGSQTAAELLTDEDGFIDEGSDDELELDMSSEATATLRSTAVLLIPFLLHQEIACVLDALTMLMKRGWCTELSEEVLTDVKFQELPTGYIAKQRYYRLQASFLHASDAEVVRRKEVVHQALNGKLFKLHWLHTVDPTFAREKALNPQAIAVVVKGVSAEVELVAIHNRLAVYPIESRGKSAFLRCTCLHRVQHPVTGVTQMPTRIDRALVSQSLLPYLTVAAHVKPDEPVADHGFAVLTAFRLNEKVCTGPGLWRLHASMVNRPGVRKIIEATVRRTPVNDGSSFELLVARLSAGLRAYAREESKRVRATVAHLTNTVAILSQRLMGDPLCTRTRELLKLKEGQLKMYQAAKKERLHIQAGSTAEMTGEIASKHLSAKVQARKVRTQITELKDGVGSITGSKEILDAASAFFRNIFGADRRVEGAVWNFTPVRRLDERVAETLAADWTEEEVKRAFAAMARNKSPGSDGLPKELFEAHWDLLGESFMVMAKSFASSAFLPAEAKEAVTILLHKKGDKEQLNNYRPITLLNFTYKVLARVVADRMKSVLHMVISPEQYGFIPGRRLSDAVALVADIIEGAKNGREDWYLLLVDFQKAFDSVERRGLGLEKDGHRLGYLGYADDTTLVLQGREQISQAEEVLDLFEKASGLATNKAKSVVLPLGVNIGASDDGAGGFKWAGADEAERLLGVWVTPSGSGRPTWEKAWNRVSEKLTKWQLKYLTITARATVVNFYITPILAFQAQIYPPPADIWLEIMRLLHSFTSGNRVATAKGFILWSRELLYTPRLDGGIGVRDPEILITCLAARRVGLFITEQKTIISVYHVTRLTFAH